MDIRLGLNQQTGLQQQLNLAPQLLQWLKLLQIPTAELSLHVSAELEKNPALEIDAPESDRSAQETDDGAPTDLADTLRTEETSFSEDRLGEKYELLVDLDDAWHRDDGAAMPESASADDDQEKHNFVVDSCKSETTLVAHLRAQLQCSDTSEDDRNLAEWIIGSLDNRGYLTASFEELATMASSSPARMEFVVRLVQRLGPPGVAARDLRECLLLQMSHFPAESLARRIVADHLDALASQSDAELARSLGVEVSDVAEARATIRTLQPVPSRDFDSVRTDYVIPDATIKVADGRCTVELTNQRIPRLRISASCRRLLEEKQLTPSEAAYVRDRIRAAAFLIQGIRQRDETLQKVIEQIAQFQHDYFVRPNGRLRPLTMARIAGILHVHETTVSRAIANKFAATPHGVHSLKVFFQPGYSCQDGSSITPDTVKTLVHEMIDKENPVCPLRDVDIAKMFARRGLRVARRTIAKYREEMSIASSKERKVMYDRMRRGAA